MRRAERNDLTRQKDKLLTQRTDLLLLLSLTHLKLCTVTWFNHLNTSLTVVALFHIFTSDCAPTSMLPLYISFSFIPLDIFHG